ncbi:hypothetical protein NDU88_007027 [Pleurodeles waltl]|uniref:Uncharacterized protein n=1 Tax=Pleurodeles waltl TaxID=8319 RepID=A0AAV7WCA1_PLEWA|nr:hypothetical protein NDU88_007027 [Pleurodeles waltl]
MNLWEGLIAFRVCKLGRRDWSQAGNLKWRLPEHVKAGRSGNVPVKETGWEPARLWTAEEPSWSHAIASLEVCFRSEMQRPVSADGPRQSRDARRSEFGERPRGMSAAAGRGCSASTVRRDAGRRGPGSGARTLPGMGEPGRRYWEKRI